MNLKRILAATLCSMLGSCADFSGIVPHARRVDPQAMDAGSALQAQGDAAWPNESWWQDYGDAQRTGKETKRQNDRPKNKAQERRNLFQPPLLRVAAGVQNCRRVQE